ncbi:CLUMA_CG002471, isoform A [Clunio marinus]|uniref:CLUMA_CG002471, isoform A n=1 Tax=Clunio marinus TaxID=568069 RepID=A0A1J1HKX8_9DIPT|nr:CLUMA_CG002471, isoform A [Clunio marinus]
MKFLILFVIIGSSEVWKLYNAERILSYTSISCAGSNKTILISECYVKPVSKQQSGLNVVLDFIKTVNSAKLSYDFSVKIGKRFVSLINGDNIDICSFLSGTSNTTSIKYAMNLVKHALPKGSLHPCPLLGHHELLNITVGRPGSNLVLPGTTYKLYFWFYNENDRNITTINITLNSVNITN